MSFCDPTKYFLIKHFIFMGLFSLLFFQSGQHAFCPCRKGWIYFLGSLHFLNVSSFLIYCRFCYIKEVKPYACFVVFYFLSSDSRTPLYHRKHNTESLLGPSALQIVQISFIQNSCFLYFINNLSQQYFIVYFSYPLIFLGKLIFIL